MEVGESLISQLVAVQGRGVHQMAAGECVMWLVCPL